MNRKLTFFPVLAVVLAVALVPVSAAEADIIKGPYLQQLTPTSIVIMWETDSAAGSRVDFGLAAPDESYVEDPTLVTIHEMQLTGLTPDTPYYYTVTSDEVTSPQSTFATAPETERSFRFVAYGDTRTDAGAHAAVIQAIIASEPEFVLHSGDLVSDGDNKTVWGPEFFDPAYYLMINTPLLPIIGNHEGSGNLFRDFFSLGDNDDWFAFSYSNVRFIGLNTHNASYSPGSDQYNWLAGYYEGEEWVPGELESAECTSADWQIVYFHHPPYTATSSHSDEIGVQTHLVPLFEEHGVDMVFNGHSHAYERYFNNGIYYIVTGGGGAPLASLVEDTVEPIREFGESVYHHCVIDVDVENELLTLSARYNNGQEFDGITITKTSQASNPNPADTATDVSINADLSWTAGAGATEHYVYLWYEVDFQQVYVVNGDVTYEPTYILDVLAPATTYYWVIDERDSGGGVTPGAVWSFQTSAAPGQASNPSPTGTDVGVDSDLSWTAGSDTTSHDVYFGINPTPGVAEFQGNQPGATFDPVMDYVTTYYWRIDEVGPGGVTAGEVWSFTTVVAAPGQASNPSPTGTDVPIDADLNWDAGEEATSHDVYFGATSPGEFQGNQMETTFVPDTMMANDTTYYWRIDEKNAGGTTTATVWIFTPVVVAPCHASSPNPPADGAESVAIDADLSWTAGAGATSHDVFFGITSPGDFQGNQTGTTYEPGLLNPGTPYYWRIDEVGPGGITTGPVWSFTTTPAETAYDAYVSQEPIVTFGEVEGTIQGTIEADDDLVQEITEVPDGHPLNGSLQVEYVLHTTADRTDITDLTLYLGVSWTGLDAFDPITGQIKIWDGSSWTNITGDMGSSFTPAEPQNYVDAAGDIRVLFTDTIAQKKEKKDTLTVDLLYAHIAAGPVNNPPVVSISSPSDGATIGSGVVISFVGTATDVEDSDLTGGMTWQSSIEGQIGPPDGGGSFTATLTDGVHLITASATDSGGKTGLASVSITVGDPPPAAPTGLVATAGNGQVSLDWDDNSESDVLGYNVYRSDTPGESYTQIATLIATSDYLDLSVENDTTYYYVVTAVDTGSNESNESSGVSATPGVSDVVTITRADYRSRQGVFTVQATSSQGGTAELWVQGYETYGAMIYNVEENVYTFRQTLEIAPGEMVTVTSSLGGEDTGPVTKK